MNVYIESYGCSRRKIDVSKFHKYFNLNGFSVVDKPESADVIVVTTCAFKHDEEEESIKAIEDLEKYRNAQIIVYGCLPAIAPSKYNSKFNYKYISPKDIDSIDSCFNGIKYRFADVEDANLISNKDNYSPLPKAIKKFTTEFEFSRPFFAKSCRYVKHKFFSSDQMFYLSTSRGCLGNCSYCAVRFAVGTIKSKPLPVIRQEFSRGLEAGYKDFTVIGDDVGAYGQDIGSNLCQLIAGLLQEATAHAKGKSSASAEMHIEEINPRWVIRYEQDIVKLLASKSVGTILCPVQSGNARILKLMNREDDIDHLLAILSKIHERNPDVQLNTQIIVGFPTETEEEFEESLIKVSRGKFSSVVLFPYDDKENTAAYEIAPKIAENVVADRIKKAQVFLRRHGIKSALCCNE